MRSRARARQESSVAVSVVRSFIVLLFALPRFDVKPAGLPPLSHNEDQEPAGNGDGDGESDEDEQPLEALRHADAEHSSTLNRLGERTRLRRWVGSYHAARWTAASYL